MRREDSPDSVVPLWTDAQLAQFLQIAPQTIANRVSQGRPMPPYVRIGGARRWFEGEVVAWLKSR